MISSTIWPVIPVASRVEGSRGTMGSFELCVTLRSGFALLTSLILAAVGGAEECAGGGAGDGADGGADGGAAYGRTGLLAAEFCVASRLIRSKASSNPFAPALGGGGRLALEGEKLELIGLTEAIVTLCGAD